MRRSCVPLVHFTESGHLSVGDAIQVLVLIVLVVVTFWYAMSTEKIYRATLNTELNSSMPIVKLRVVSASEDEVVVEYKNVGRGPALNVRLWMARAHDPDFADLKGNTMVFPSFASALALMEANEYNLDQSRWPIPLNSNRTGHLGRI